MMGIESNTCVLNKEQYNKVASDSDILTEMYEMKLGHELRLDGNKYIMKFIDRQAFDIFMAYIYNPYLKS